MQEPLVSALRARRPHARQHWETLLRVEPHATPLADPDALAHLIDWTLDEIYATIANPIARHRTGRHRPSKTEPAVCACRENPLHGYFTAGGQAMREALILAQAATPILCPLERDASFQELNLVLAEISHREIEAFCCVCRLRERGDATPRGQRAGRMAALAASDISPRKPT